MNPICAKLSVKECRKTGYSAISTDCIVSLIMWVALIAPRMPIDMFGDVDSGFIFARPASVVAFIVQLSLGGSKKHQGVWGAKTKSAINSMPDPRCMHAAHTKDSAFESARRLVLQ